MTNNECSNNESIRAKRVKFDLEERTLVFAKNCRDYIKTLPRSIYNIEYAKQLVRASGSVAANYIEANDAVSRKDFTFRIKVCRKESKESRLWLILSEPQQRHLNTRNTLIQEALELNKIFGSILKRYRE